jgi:uncharacterized membrane protein YhaH (DUF805 family)
VQWRFATAASARGSVDLHSVASRIANSVVVVVRLRAIMYSCAINGAISYNSTPSLLVMPLHVVVLVINGAISFNSTPSLLVKPLHDELKGFYEHI